MIHTRHIDDSNPKAKVFLEFIRTLDFVGISDGEQIVIPQWQQEEVLKRIAETKPEDYIPWEEARKRLRFKH